MFEALIFHQIVTALQGREGKPADLYSLLENWQHKINTEKRHTLFIKTAVCVGKNWLWKHEWRSIPNNLIFQCLQSDKAQKKQPAQSDHPPGLERLVFSTGSTLQDATLFPFHFYLHPEITSERRSSQQGLSSLALRKKTREPVSISGSITDALKAFALIVPLCQRYTQSLCAPVPQHSLNIQRHLLQDLHLLPSKSPSLRHCPISSCSSSLSQRAKRARGNLTYVTSAPQNIFLSNPTVILNVYFTQPSTTGIVSSWTEKKKINPWI